MGKMGTNTPTRGNRGFRSVEKLEVILFTSPKAGSGAAREQIPRLADLLAAAGIKNQILSCPSQLRTITDHCRETGVSQPVVVAAGGDGTISLVASSSHPETPLLPMPMGTENLIARHFGQTNDAETVMKTLQSGRRIKLDAGHANGRLFLIMATVGFDAEVVRRLHLRRKGHIRRHSYFKPILHTLLRYPFPKLRVTAIADSGGTSDSFEAGWAMTFNLPCYAAGLKIQPDAIGDDRQLDLITFAGRGITSGLKYLFGIVTGLHRRFGDVREHRVTRVRIESDHRVAYELDGDYAGKLPLEIQTLPERITLLVPR